MPATADDILTGLLSKSLNLDATGVAELKESDGTGWKEDALAQLLKKDQDRIAAIRADFNKQKNDQYLRGKREVMESFESDLRGEHGMDAELKGKDLVNAILAKKVQAAGTMDEAKVKTHPLYLQQADKINGLPKAIAEAVKAREEALQAEFRSERTTSRIMERGKAIFKGMNPILPKNEVVAQAQMTLLDAFLKAGKYQVVEKDGEITDIFVMESDGSGRLKDGHGNEVTFESYVKSGASKFFEFAQGEPKTGAPDPAKTGDGSTRTNGTHVAFDPRTVSDYAKQWGRIDREVFDPIEKQAQWAALKEAGIKNGVAS